MATNTASFPNLIEAPRRLRFRFGIGARLVMAFVVIVGLAVGACVVGWLSYVSLSSELSQIARSQMPRLASATRLSKAGADINSVMPNLAAAASRASYSSIRTIYARRLDLLNGVLSAMAAEGIDSTALVPLVEAINQNLSKLDIAAGKRFTLSEEIRADVEELRWVQTDLLEEAEPLVDDARFNMEAELRLQGREEALLEEQQKSEALLSLVAEANLSSGLIARLADIGSIEDLQETMAYLGDSTDQLQASQQALAGWPDSITVRQLADRLLESADAKAGLPNLKRVELIELDRVRALAAENRQLVEELAERISLEVAAAENGAREASIRADEAISTGSTLLLAIAVLAVVVALTVGYLYVHRNLLARIRELADAASNISAGRSHAALPPDGQNEDELGDLARALTLFRHTRDELVQSAKLAALGQMAAGIGHELNQPLAAIRSHTHNGAVLIGRGEEQKALRNLEKIEQLTVRMSDQIGHLRRFARLPDTRLGPVDLLAAVNDAVGLLAHRFEDEDVQLLLDVPDLRVFAERVRLEQVFVNLLANALDAVAGQDVRKISIEVASTGQRVDIKVKDTGTGIKQEEINAVFDPFFTTKPASSGLGLGLSISYNIVKDFDGAISVQSSSDKGTTFLVSLKAVFS